MTNTGYAVIAFVILISFIAYSDRGSKFLRWLPIWLIWDFSGLRFIYRKIVSETNEELEKPGYKKPVTFFLWFIGIYTATFGVASNRYENRVDIIENRINGIYAQISKDLHLAFQRINDVQDMPCPVKPEILKPLSIIRSFLPPEDKQYDEQYEEGKIVRTINALLTNKNEVEQKKDRRYKEGVEQLQQLVEDWARRTETIKQRTDKEPKAEKWIKEKIKSAVKKDGTLDDDEEIGQLAGVDLSGANLEGANLRWARLEGANLRWARLEGANLGNARLEGAYLGKARLKNTCLCQADLKNAKKLLNFRT